MAVSKPNNPVRKLLLRLQQSTPIGQDWALLALRVLASLSLLVVHGGHKIIDWQTGIGAFPDPFGMGPEITFGLAVISNGVSPILVILGLCTRLATLPVLATTLTGFFLIHWHDSLEVMDTPYIYSVVFLTILLLGPGRYSLDARFWGRN